MNTLFSRKLALRLIGCVLGMTCLTNWPARAGAQTSSSDAKTSAPNCSMVFSENDLEGKLQLLGYDSSLSKRIVHGSPAIAALAISEAAQPKKYYRGMMIPLNQYNPNRNSIYMTPSKEMALRYSSGGAYDAKFAGTYVHIVFEYTFPNIAHLTRPGGPGNKNATLPTFSIPDERTFISAIGMTVETDSNPVSVWFTYDEAFDSEGQLRADLQKLANERSLLVRAPTIP